MWEEATQQEDEATCVALFGNRMLRHPIRWHALSVRKSAHGGAKGKHWKATESPYARVEIIFRTGALREVRLNRLPYESAVPKGVILEKGLCVPENR